MPEAKLTVVYVFFASPGDLPDEREAARELVEQFNRGIIGSEWRVEAIFWEDKGPSYGRPQDEMNRWLDRCHIFVGMLWRRWGTPTGDYSSGFEEEFERAIARRRETGKPDVWIYLKDVDPGQLDDPGAELQKVLAFKERVESEELVFYRRFDSLDDWRFKLSEKLLDEITSRIAATAPSGEQTVGQAEDIQAPQPGASVEQPERVRSHEPEPGPVIEDGGRAGAEADLERLWADALLGGALDQAGVAEKAEKAAGLLERTPKTAARLLVEVADALDRTRPVIAERYREQAANAYLAADAGELAAALLVQVARSQIERVASSAPLTARRLAASSAPVMGQRAVALPAERSWLGEALLARADWPEHLPEALDALRLAAEQAAGDEDEVEWAAALVELLVIAGAFEEAIERARPVRTRWPLQPGYRVSLELAALDADEETDGLEAVDADWERLLAWGDDRADADPALGAHIWQRRGVALAIREDLPGARVAFVRAAGLWSQVEGHEDQVAEAYFAEQTADQLAGDLDPRASELRPVAATLRGAADTAAARGDRLEREGLGARIAGKLFDARRSFWLAYAEHRRAGNLRGQLAVMELIAELYDEAGRPVQAVAAYVASAREDKAGRTGRVARPADDLLPVLTLDLPIWERAASFAVVAAVGRRLSERAVAELAPRLLEEAERQPTSLVSPQPVLRAQEALAAVAFGLPDTERARGLELLRALARGGYVGTARPAAQALILLTNAGRSDETTVLTEAFLADPGVSGVSSIWIGGRLADSDEAREAVRNAALEGRVGPLEAAAVAELPVSEPELAEHCSRYIEGVISSPTVRIEETQRSVSIASFEGAGIVARVCPPELRRRFVARMLQIAAGTEDPEINRASAANALFNVAPDLPSDEAAPAVESLLPLALGQYGESDWEETSSRREDPFVRFNLSFGAPRPLRSAALQALGSLAGRPEQVDERVGEALREALWAGRDELVAAAYEALARLPRLEPPGPLEAAFGSRAQQVRLGVLRCWFARGREVPQGALLERLLADEAVMVRLVLGNLASERGLAGRGVLERLQEDEDAYVRALADQEFRHSEASEARTRRRPRRPPTP